MYFAGLDAHLRYVTVPVLDRLGGVALETTVPTRAPDHRSLVNDGVPLSPPLAGVSGFALW